MLAGRVFMWLAFLAVVAVAGGFYIQYRQGQSELVQHITSLDQIQGVAPTLCVYQAGGYGTGGSGGAIYIENNEMRIDVPDLEVPGFSGTMEAVLGTDGTRLIDPASLNAGISNNAASVLNALITQASWGCSPWWLPNSTVFTIPNAVSF